MESQIASWFDALDLIDPFFGDTAALSALRDTAPTPELSAWLGEQMQANQRFVAQFCPA